MRNATRGRGRLLNRWVLCGVLFAALLSIAAPSRAEESELEERRSAVQRNQNDPRARLEYGRALLGAGRAGEAIVELRRGIGMWSARGGEIALDLHWELARAHLARHENGQAIVRCQIVRDKPGGGAFGRACSAEAWLSSLRASESHTEIKEARKFTDIPARVDYSLHTSEGIAYALELKYQEAEAALEAAIKIDPEAVAAHIALGRLLVQEGKDGSAHLRRAVELAPNNADALFELARTLPRGPEATALLNRAVVERPTFAAAHRLIATIELAAGHLAPAKKAAETALRIDPTDIASHLVMGDVALAENRLDDALREGQAAIALVANSAAARQLMADAYAKKGEIDLALENYQAAYGGDHSNPASLVNASVACLAAGRPTSAKAFGEKATQEFPDWGPAWVAFGDSLVANQDTAGARNAYGRARRAQGPVDQAALERKIASLK